MLDLEPIRARLQKTESGFWENNCRSFADQGPGDQEFIYHAPGDVSALLDEVGYLRSELAETKAALQDTEDDLCEARERLDDLDIDL